MERQVTWKEILDTHYDGRRQDEFRVIPGIVVAYHAPTQSADVQPAVTNYLEDPDTSQVSYEVPPIFPSVKVAFPRFGGFTIAGPLLTGDKVVLVAFDMDPSVHFLSGTLQKPIDLSKHRGKFWLAIPCNLTDPGLSLSAGVAATSLVIGVDGQPTAQLVVTPSGLVLGGPTAAPLATTAAVAAIQAFCTTVSAIPPATNPATTQTLANGIQSATVALNSALAAAGIVTVNTKAS